MIAEHMGLKQLKYVDVKSYLLCGWLNLRIKVILNFSWIPRNG